MEGGVWLRECRSGQVVAAFDIACRCRAKPTPMALCVCDVMQRLTDIFLMNK